MSKKFVVSSHHYESLKEAEQKVTGWLMGGQFDQKCRLYRIVEEYRPTIKFIKTKIIK